MNHKEKLELKRKWYVKGYMEAINQMNEDFESKVYLADTVGAIKFATELLKDGIDTAEEEGK